MKFLTSIVIAVCLLALAVADLEAGCRGRGRMFGRRQARMQSCGQAAYQGIGCQPQYSNGGCAGGQCGVSAPVSVSRPVTRPVNAPTYYAVR